MTIQIGTLSPGHAEDFLVQLERAIEMLDTLAQIQACAGTQGMQHRAGKTENVRASLENYMRMLRYQEQQEARRR
jgi:hypothetical protein